MSMRSIAELAKEKILVHKGEKPDKSTELEDAALEDVLATKILNKLTGQAYYGWWGGYYGIGYPVYNPAYHPVTYHTGEPMASVYPYYPMDILGSINALKAYHDAFIISGVPT